MQSDFIPEVVEPTEPHKVSSKIKLSSFNKKQKVEISEADKAEKHPLVIQVGSTGHMSSKFKAASPTSSPPTVREKRIKREAEEKAKKEAKAASFSRRLTGNFAF